MHKAKGVTTVYAKHVKADLWIKICCIMLDRATESLISFRVQKNMGLLPMSYPHKVLLNNRVVLGRKGRPLGMENILW